MDSYNYDSGALTSLIKSFEDKLTEYSAEIQKIETLKTTMENSNEWVQDMIKSPFIAKCNEYIKYYNDSITKLEAHIAYLKKKNLVMESLEDSYS